MKKKHEIIRYRLEELVVPDEMDIDGLENFLDEYSECEICNINSNNNSCTECIYFNHSSGESEKTRKIRVACKPSVFGKYFGLINSNEISEVGRTRIVYFHRHPELYYRLPSLPDEDFFGNTNSSRWEFHHYEDMYNDRKVVRVTNREHARFQAMQDRGDYLWLNILLRTRERHPSLDIGTVIDLSMMKRYYNSWRKIDGKWVLKDGVNIKEEFYSNVFI